MRHLFPGFFTLSLLLFSTLPSAAQAVTAVAVGTSRQVRTTKSGTKADVLKTELLRFNVCPTRGTLDLLERLNPQLKYDTALAEGTSFILPLLSEPAEAVQEKMDGFLEKDNQADKTANARFLKNAAALHALLLPWLKAQPQQNAWQENLSGIDSLLRQVLAKRKTAIKKYHTDILNTAMEQFTRNLSTGVFKSNPDSAGVAYAQSFRNYFYQVAAPYFSSASPSGFINRSRSGTAAVETAWEFSAPTADPPNTAVDVWIHVLVPVPQQGKFTYIDSMDQYWVYCLSEFQFDNLNRRFMSMRPADKRTLNVLNLKQLVTVDDLERTQALCPSPASVTAKRIDTRFAYHFIVASLNKKTIVVHDWIDLAKYAFQLKDGKYGLGLYQSIN